MTWVSWRLHRTQLLIIGTLAVLAAVAMTTTGRPPMSLAVHDVQALAWGLLFALPVAAGVVVGVTVTARERERFTNRLAWTQGISRTRWLLATLVPVAVVGSVAVALISSIATWWVAAAGNGPRIDPNPFDVSGVVPVAYFLASLGLGVLAGSVIRNEGLAGASAAIAAIAARIVVRNVVRPHLAPVVHLTSAHFPLRDLGPIWSSIPGGSAVEHGWILGYGWVPAGRTTPLPGHSWYSSFRPATGSDIVGVRCPVVTPSGSRSSFSVHSDCSNPAHLHFVVNFQPLSHYWLLQAGEAGIFLAGAIAFVALAAFLLRRSSE
ncbi:MAG: hypothetical protein M0Z62_03985 [Actinomycetota bacterium]|nr:hypothetical protein [Actinomycetota bacterium]